MQTKKPEKRLMKSNSKEHDWVTEEVSGFGNAKIANIGEILDTQPKKLSGDGIYWPKFSH